MGRVSVREVNKDTADMSFEERVLLFKDQVDELIESLERGSNVVLDLCDSDRVMLKPNICVGGGYETGAITDPALVRAIAGFIEDRGGSPFIAEGPVIGNTGKEVFLQSGYDKISGIELVDLYECDFVEKEVPDSVKKEINQLEVLDQGCRFDSIEIAKDALKSDYIINIPSLKTHVLTKVTLSLKNMKGIISEREKKKFHKKGLVQGIVILNQLISSDLSIIDGLIGQEGLGPINGSPINSGLLIAGSGSTKTDIVGSRYMGIEPNSSDVIKVSKNLIADSNISEVGEVEYRDFKEPGEAKDYENVDIYSENACSGCMSAVYSILARLDSEGELEEIFSRYNDLVVYVGSAVDEKDKEGFEVAVGRCCTNLKQDVDLYLPGCPPIEMLSEDAIRTKALAKEPNNTTKSEIESFIKDK